jgi:hypothetical protein
MTEYKLSLEKQAPVGDGYDIAMRSMDWCKAQIMELKALLNYKSDSMIALNKSRVLADIDSIVESVEDLKRMINEIE